MTALVAVVNLMRWGHRWLITGGALGAGAVGAVGLALILACPTNVLEAGLGAALGTALASGVPSAPPVAPAG